MAIIQTLYGDKAIINAIVAGWNGSSRLRCHLFKNNFTPEPTSVPSDFVECDYEGYTYQEVTGWTPAIVVGNVAQTSATPLLFVHTAGTTANTIYGFWCEPIDDLGNVFLSMLFGTPVVLSGPPDAFLLYPYYTNTTD